ncbi:MAG: tRNA (cytidine(34)-2'-O)-methyltransferase [Nitrospirae bacterium]|nr:tRNA (cytidine(34)-2'-O)-methyltransferase [Nitrospirota bacterium]
MHVVLVDPEIPWNTGNIGRTCVATGATLHLVGRLGFRLEAKEIRRAGLDYWPHLRWHRHEELNAFLASIPPDAPIAFFSARARRTYLDAPFERGMYMVFGGESGGLPRGIRRRFSDRLYRIPTSRRVRSLNLSTAVGIVLYEALRQVGRGARRTLRDSERVPRSDAGCLPAEVRPPWRTGQAGSPRLPRTRIRGRRIRGTGHSRLRACGSLMTGILSARRS